MGAPSRRARLAVAVAMTTWTVLQAATLVVAAVRGGDTSDALVFTYTGMVTMALTALTVVAWRWVARARPGPPPVASGTPTDRTPIQRTPDDSAPTGPTPAVATEETPTVRHRGLAGHEQPPTRW